MPDLDPNIPWWVAVLILPLGGWLGAIINDIIKSSRSITERDMSAYYEAESEIRKTFLDLIKKFDDLLDSYLRSIVALQFEMQEFRRKQEALTEDMREIKDIVNNVHTIAQSQRSIEDAIRRVEVILSMRKPDKSIETIEQERSV